MITLTMSRPMSSTGATAISSNRISDDEPAAVRLRQDRQQILTGTALAKDLAATDDLPEFDAGAPAATFPPTPSPCTRW